VGLIHPEEGQALYNGKGKKTRGQVQEAYIQKETAKIKSFPIRPSKITGNFILSFSLNFN